MNPGTSCMITASSLSCRFLLIFLAINTVTNKRATKADPATAVIIMVFSALPCVEPWSSAFIWPALVCTAAREEGWYTSRPEISEEKHTRTITVWVRRTTMWTWPAPFTVWLVLHLQDLRGSRHHLLWWSSCSSVCCGSRRYLCHSPDLDSNSCHPMPSL